MTKIDFLNFKKSRKKIETNFSKKIFEKKKSMKVEHFEISDFFRIFWNSKIFNFHWLFQRVFIRFFFISKNIFEIFLLKFWKSIFVMKKYYFSSRFFSWQDMIVHFHFRTSRSVKKQVKHTKTKNIYFS